jgi:putative ABC transport system permease protein
VEVVVRQAPRALSPDAPHLLRVAAPPDPETLRAGVESDLNALFLLLGAVSLLVGALGIANVTLVSVLERVGEIGLRRALGAARRHIAAQFLVESGVMGLLGGIVGTALGVLVVVAVSAGRTWTPVLDPWVPLVAPFVGALIGLLSGAYPALRAAALEPVEALRAGT